MAGDTFTTFYGEFLVSPIGLELSLNYCSHSCAYCFANLNSQSRHDRQGSPLRYADVKGTMNLLKDYQNRDSLEAYWLKEGYPVLISNKVDPFANSNYRTSLPIMEMMTELDIPIALQTKGGRGVDEALEFLKPAVWYISIEFNDDALSRQVNPAAPSIESRYELISKVIAKGHQVVVGVNPLASEWAPEPAKIFQRCKDLGVWGVWLSLLHFNRDQAAIARKQGIIPEAMLERYKKSKKHNPETLEFFIKTRQSAREHGLEVYTGFQSTYSRYWDVYKKIYPKLLPTLQDWVNHCWESGWDKNRLITFQEFADFFEPQLPKGRLALGHYIGSINRQVTQEAESWTNWMTFRQLLHWAWREPRLSFNPVNSPGFAYVGNENWQPKDKAARNLLRDNRGNPYMSFWQQHQEFLGEEI